MNIRINKTASTNAKVTFTLTAAGGLSIVITAPVKNANACRNALSTLKAIITHAEGADSAQAFLVQFNRKLDAMTKQQAKRRKAALVCA